MVVDLPSSERVALLAVVVLAGIVVWDAFWLTRQRKDIPELGNLPGGGFAWASEGVHEMVRQWGNLGSMAAMMVLPWALLEVSDTPLIYAIVWDVLLSLHLISLPTVSATRGSVYAWPNANQNDASCCFEMDGGSLDRCP